MPIDSTLLKNISTDHEGKIAAIYLWDEPVYKKEARALCRALLKNTSIRSIGLNIPEDNETVLEEVAYEFLKLLVNLDKKNTTILRISGLEQSCYHGQINNALYQNQRRQNLPDYMIPLPKWVDPPIEHLNLPLVIKEINQYSNKISLISEQVINEFECFYKKIEQKVDDILKKRQCEIEDIYELKYEYNNSIEWLTISRDISAVHTYQTEADIILEMISRLASNECDVRDDYFWMKMSIKRFREVAYMLTDLRLFEGSGLIQFKTSAGLRELIQTPIIQFMDPIPRVFTKCESKEDCFPIFTPLSLEKINVHVEQTGDQVMKEDSSSSTPNDNRPYRFRMFKTKDRVTPTSITELDTPALLDETISDVIKIKSKPILRSCERQGFDYLF